MATPPAVLGCVSLVRISTNTGWSVGLPPVFAVRDVLDGSVYDWRLGGNYVRLEPGHRQAHVLEVLGT